MHYLFVASRYIIYLKVWHRIALEGKLRRTRIWKKSVLKTSANVTYYVLVVFIFGLFFASVGFNRWIDFHNIPLLFALCAAIVVKPAVEFLIVRRYR